MNCNPCCGCLPPITTYDPSVANNFPTILQQVEYLKALLKKYPSQQWFITQEKVTEETKSLNKLSILSNGREPQGGDFILGNKENGTTLLFQYTGVITEYVNYNLIYVGVFTNQDLAQQALSLAQVNEQDITSAEARITSLEAEASIEVTITPASATSGTLTEEQYNKLITNDNCYIKLNEVVYTLSKNSATGVLIYSSKYLSDTKTVRTITVTKSSKAWVMTEVSVGGGGGKIYSHLYAMCFTNASAEIGEGAVNNSLNYAVFFNITTDSNIKPFDNIAHLLSGMTGNNGLPYNIRVTLGCVRKDSIPTTISPYDVKDNPMQVVVAEVFSSLNYWAVSQSFGSQTEKTKICSLEMGPNTATPTAPYIEDYQLTEL